MSQNQSDIWSEWLLKRRFGGNREQMQKVAEFLYPVRDKVLANARLQVNQTLLDVGCGDDLIAFGALQQEPSCQVIFSDISQPLLDESQQLAQEMGVLPRCQFINVPAEDLSLLADETVDVVTTRSVLIYVTAKQQAFREFYRVLKPGGRLSIFEPINRFRFPPPAHSFWGYDVTAVQDLAQKVKDRYRQVRPPENDTMIDFDEYDLIAFTEQAGFTEVHLELHIDIAPDKTDLDFETRLHMAPNPLAPSTAEAIEQALTPTEAEKFTAFLRQKWDEGPGVRPSSMAYLWAVKGSANSA